MSKTKAADYLQQLSLLRLIAVLALVLSAHLARLPAWEIVFVLAALGWRVLASLRQWTLPRPALRAMLTLAVVAGVGATYRSLNGQDPGTALLAGMAVLKLLEMRTRRDVMVTVFLMYFILLTHFLYSQEIWTIGYLFVCTIAITAILMDVNHPLTPLPLRVLVRGGSQLVLWSVPLMLLLFVLFPRIPGPLWGLAADSGVAATGLSDEMSPGDIARLINTDAVAFRVRFLDDTPPMRQRYWRGPVFDTYDGQRWSANKFSRTDRTPPAELRGAPVRYELTLEPHRRTWLFALDLPQRDDLPEHAYISSEYQLAQRTPVRERLMYTLSSHPEYSLQATDLGPLFEGINTQLPRASNPRAQELGRRLRREHLGDPERIARALFAMYTREDFVYTLRPPTLGVDGVDDFLFSSRRGFCEHYAGSFTFVMRAAGIPARVVGGYMGGEQNEFGDYYVVRQADAHAWTEVWIDSRGWVRFDPTSAVSPDRIEQGLSSALSAAEGLPDFLGPRGPAWFDLERVQARWDWVNAQWNRWVLAYGPELQMEFLARFGLTDWSDMVLALTILGSLALGIVGLMTLRQFAPARNEDRALRLWQRALRKLMREGIAQRPSEGPRDFVVRISEENPEFAAPMQRVLRGYLQLRYLAEPAPDIERELEAEVRAL